MNFTYEIAKQIGPYMRSRGFKRKGKRFYNIQNDIAFCIEFEMPSDSIYVWAYILPLYMPCDFITLSYGNRLGNMPSIMLPLLNKTDSTEQISAWCALLCSRIEDTILPFFRSIDSPLKLAVSIEKDGEFRKFMHCPEIHMAELRIYTHLYLRNQIQLQDAMECYEKELKGYPYTFERRQKQMDWLKQMRILSESDEETICAYLNQAMEITQRHFKK